MMRHGDVSFTFLSRVEEIELNIRDSRWQSALALALTIPDICGGIAFPELVKRYRDGRVMLDRQKNPTRDVGGQYIRWFAEYAASFFKLSEEDAAPYICGERCWQLRCEYLHQNKGFLNDEADSEVRFHLGVNCGSSVCQVAQEALLQGPLDIRIDIEQFCLRMCRASRSYYEREHQEKDFHFYNTPVLDFIEVTQDSGDSDRLIVIVCGDRSYAKGLKLALQNVSGRILLFDTPKAARRGGSREVPSLWIVTGEMLEQPDQPWRADQGTPVILLTRDPGAADGIKKAPGKRTVLAMPAEPEALRNAVSAHLR